MSFKLTAPEAQDIETLETLCDLVDTFLMSVMDVANAADLGPTPEMMTEGEALINDAIAVSQAGNEDTEILAMLPMLRMADFGLRTAFEVAATVEEAQEKMLTFVPQDLGSEVNANLIEKYELIGLATLVQRAKGPSP